MAKYRNGHVYYFAAAHLGANVEQFIFAADATPELPAKNSKTLHAMAALQIKIPLGMPL